MGNFGVLLRLGVMAVVGFGWCGPAVGRQEVVPNTQARAGEFGVSVQRELMIPMRDGVKLAADVYLPAKDGSALAGPFPTLLVRTPYSKGDGKVGEAEYYAKRGYAVVFNDTRGRYKSEGAYRLMVDDPADGYDVVEWIAAQAWSDGKVGTFGTSYPGGTQHALAEMSPPHLSAMVPVDALSNTGVAGMRHGGAFELRFMNWMFNQGAVESKEALANPALRAQLKGVWEHIRQFTDAMPVRKGNTPLRVVPEYESWLVQALGAGPEDPMWHVKGMSVVDHVGDYKDVPVLHLTGWYDSWTRQVCMNYEALSKAKKGPHRLIIGPWVHGGQRGNVSGEVEFTKEAAIDLEGLRLRWYDRWMRGESNGVDEEPAVWVYVMGTGDDSKSPEGRLRHGGYWRSEKEWPIARTEERALYLRADGSLTEEAPAKGEGSTTYTFDPKRPVPTIGGNISSNGGLMTNGGYDQRPREDTHAATDSLPLSARRDVLVFRTEPLEKDLEVTGTVVVKLQVASTAKDTDFTAKLIDEIPPSADYPLGFDLNIGDSIVRARYRKGLERQELMKPGEPTEVEIRLYPTSNVFKKGHKLRVDVSSSNYPRFDVNPNTGDPLNTHRRMVEADNTVWHDGERASRVLLPVVKSPAGESAGRGD